MKASSQPLPSVITLKKSVGPAVPVMVTSFVPVTLYQPTPRAGVAVTTPPKPAVGV